MAAKQSARRRPILATSFRKNWIICVGTPEGPWEIPCVSEPVIAGDEFTAKPFPPLEIPLGAPLLSYRRASRKEITALLLQECRANMAWLVSEGRVHQLPDGTYIPAAGGIAS